MKITRRKFVHALGTTMAVAVSGAGVRSAFGIAMRDGARFNASAASGLFEMSADELKHLIGRGFLATSEDGQQVDLILTEVESLERPANSKSGYSGECFSVVFKGGEKDELVQGVYEMTSDGLDTFSALLVPTSRHHSEFEMVVNRLAL